MLVNFHSRLSLRFDFKICFFFRLPKLHLQSSQTKWTNSAGLLRKCLRVIPTRYRKIKHLCRNSSAHTDQRKKRISKEKKKISPILILPEKRKERHFLWYLLHTISCGLTTAKKDFVCDNKKLFSLSLSLWLNVSVTCTFREKDVRL